METPYVTRFSRDFPIRMRYKIHMGHLERYNRQILLREVGTVGQARLKNARVLIIGLGGLGCPVALYLAAAGVGTLGLVDDDRVALSNLQRQILYDPNQTGTNKVEAAGERLQNFNPDISIQTFVTKISQINAHEVFKNFDVIVDGTDSFKSRYLISRLCCEMQKPHIYGGIFRFEGHVAVFKGQPCYRCLFPVSPEAEEVPNCNQSGVIGALAGTIGSIQAMETIKFVLNLPQAKCGELFVFDALHLHSQTMMISKRPDCPHCGVDKKKIGNLDVSLAVSPNQPWQEKVAELQLSGQGSAPTNSVWLDVRNLDEVQASPVVGALHIPLLDLKTNLTQLDPMKSYIVCCQSGGRSLRAQEILLEKGFREVWNLSGGLNSTSFIFHQDTKGPVN